MASRTIGTDDRRLRRTGATPRPLAAGIVLLVLGMVAIVATGFAFINTQQEALRGLRAATEDIRTAGEALMEADSQVMHAILGDRALDGPSYYRAIASLRGQRQTLLALLDPVSARDSADVISELEDAWNAAIGFAEKGQPDAAAAVLVERATAALVGQLRDASQDFLAERDVRSSIYEERVTIGTWVVLLLQVLSGGLAISGLVYAFRSTAAEADARAMAVANADASREKVGRLFEMADVLQSASDHTDANAVLMATASDLVPGYGGALYIFNNSRDRLVLSTRWGSEGDRPLPETIAPNQCWALKRGKPHVSHANGEKLCCEHHVGEDTVLEIPMIARGEILGLMQLYARGADAEARLARVAGMGSALADGMSLALANIGLREKLRNQALRDALTGLYNRRYMEDTLERFVRLAERERREISVIMIDLDHFKRLNDEHGHAMGDAVLRDAAAAVVGSLRETDVACRYGGEELIVLLPDCDLDKATDKAEVIRQRIEELSQTHGAEVSASFGVASIPHTSSTTAELVAAADAALYKAKQAGRNRVAQAPRRSMRSERAQPAASNVAYVGLEAAE